MVKTTAITRFFQMPKIMVVFLLLLQGVFMPASALAAAQLQCLVSTTAEPWQLQVQLKNQGQQALLILRWRSPLDAWFSEFLHISQQGQQLVYQGAKAKRGEPAEEDLLLLLPGEQHSEQLDLTQAYQLAALPALVQFSAFAFMPYQAGKPLKWQPEQQLWIKCPELQLKAPVVPG